MSEEILKRKTEIEIENCSKIKKLSSSNTNFDIKGFVVDFKGEREEMQEFNIMQEDFSEFIWPKHLEQKIDERPKIRLYAIFDGHGGKQAANYAAKNLPIRLKEKLLKVNSANIHNGMKNMFVQTFKNIDDDFLQEAIKYKPTLNDGTTATVLLIIDESILYIANIGDSLAILNRQNMETNTFKSIPLTEAHEPSVYEERVRIQKCGGKVIDGRVNGILEVSRSIGDGKLKKFGVSALPSIKKCKFQEINDKYIIVACDGLWKAFTPEKAIDFVNASLKDQAEAGKSLDEAYQYACLNITQKAAKSLCGDNITVMLIRLQP